MFKILVIHYSQTGQLTDILECITSGMDDSKVEIDQIRFFPEKSFEFPWSKAGFFDAMPESVLNEGCDIHPIEYKFDQYDLIIFGYQPWYLSPSIPAMGLLNEPKFQSILKGTPVITVIGARNMWINAQKEVEKKIKAAGGILVGNIPLIDNNNNLASAVSIMHWMFTGKKTKKWGIFPKPGILEEDIVSAKIYGSLIVSGLEHNALNGLQQKILDQGKIDIRWPIMFIEARAKKLFLIWANLIKKKGTTEKKRKKWLTIFKFYLIFALFIVSPIVLFIYALFFRWFYLKKENSQKKVTLSV